MSTTQAPTLETHTGNNFDAIRIVAASMVLISHHYALTGQMEPSFFGIHSLGGLAVTFFFVISGYLVTSSWTRDPNVWRFALRRVLRIWPALTFAVVATAYLLGAWVTELPLKEYLTHRATANYLYALWMKIHFVLPGVFQNNPYALGVNGSLWTIPIEVRCYIFLGLAGLMGLLKYRAIFLSLVALFLVWFLLRSNADLTGAVHYGRELSAFFLAGAALHTLEPYWDRRPVLWACFTSAAFAVAWVIGWRHTALLIGLPFLVIFTGTRATPFIRRAGRWGDPSYGIYLFAFPIQQTVILHMWPSAGFAGTLVLSIFLTVALAYASWHLLEKQALKLKPKREQPVTVTSLLRTIRHTLTFLPVRWFWPLLACIVGLRFCLKHFDAPVLIDPTYTYLPAARAFLDQGWSFMLEPESYHVAPLAYLWPALWGVDTTGIRLANMGLWVGCVWFLWRTCCLIGGQRAAAVAMLLLLSPELVRYFPTEMTEPVYLFGVFGWMHAASRIIMGGEQSKGVVAQGAIMLAITLLARPVLQLIAPTMLFVCLVCMMRWSISKTTFSNTEWQQRIPTIALSLGFGLIIPLALIVKNGIFFGLWGLGTGSGTGLYLGTHPLFQGAEPGFLGFAFDINIMIALATDSSNHLSLAGDSAARNAALWHIQSMSISETITFFCRKLWWWLAHHPAQIEYFGSSLRKIRFFELLTLITSIVWLAYDWRRRRTTAIKPLCNDSVAHSNRIAEGTEPSQLVFAAFLLAIFLALLVQLLPILYNSRYSSTLLDPWLIPLTAFGIAYITAPIKIFGTFRKGHLSIGIFSKNGRLIWPIIFSMAAILSITLFSNNLLKKIETISIDPKHTGKTLTHLEVTTSNRIETYAMTRQEDKIWITTEPNSTILININKIDVERLASENILNALWKTKISLSSNGKKCNNAEISYQTEDGVILQPINKQSLLLSLHADGEFHSLVTHANQELRPHVPGRLRIVLHCPVGTLVKWRETKLLESRHAWEAADHARP